MLPSGDRRSSGGAASGPTPQAASQPEPGHLDETLVAPSVTGRADTVITSSGVPGSGERQLLAHRYEILALLGSGGMGTVYRARDVELDEMVALKVLRKELAEAPGILERFRREVKLARRVTHRNVARVFDIGEHEGEKFLTMEFVDGEPLSAVIAREGACSVARAAAIGHAVAEGLGSAHAAGVVHRDLKPDNVLLGKDGRVVVTDFGIARAAFEVAGAGSTMGALLGTPAYMAPEQVEGRADVDARADVYALGALLYELFTGERAWPGDAPFAVAAARLTSPPPDPRARRGALHAAAAELVLRCMARRPEERPASAAHVAAELAGLVAATASAPTPTHVSPTAPHAQAAPLTPVPSGARGDRTVAVLPFRNAGAVDDDYLAEELTDDLIDALSMTRGLKVRSRGAVARFRGAVEDPRDVGRELGVEVVVEGSVRRARGSVRISARLVSVADGFQLWAKRFDRPEQEVLSINDDAARAIAGALTLDRTAAHPAREAPRDPRALDLYIRARHEYRKFWKDHVDRAVALYREALALAPDDTLILSGLAIALARRAFFGKESDFVDARRIAEQVVAAAPELGEGQLALGSVLFYTGEPVLAARALRRAVAQSPGLADAHAALGRLLVEVGAADEGTRRLEAALALDPDVPNARLEIGRVHALAGRWEQADAELEKLRARDDAFAFWTGRARTALWRRQMALVEQYVAQLGDGERTLRIPQMMLALAKGEPLPAEAQAQLDVPEGPARQNRRRVFMHQMRAEMLGFIGDTPGTVESIRSSVRVGLIDLLWLERCPLLEAARADPSYPALRAEVTRRTDEILAAYREG